MFGILASKLCMGSKFRVYVWEMASMCYEKTMFDLASMENTKLSENM